MGSSKVVSHESTGLRNIYLNKTYSMVMEMEMDLPLYTPHITFSFMAVYNNIF